MCKGRRVVLVTDPVAREGPEGRVNVSVREGSSLRRGNFKLNDTEEDCAWCIGGIAWSPG